MTHVLFITDAIGDVVEVELFCGAACMRDHGLDPAGNGWPCPEQADYDQHCAHCGALIVAGLSEDRLLDVAELRAGTQ